MLSLLRGQQQRQQQQSQQQQQRAVNVDEEVAAALREAEEGLVKERARLATRRSELRAKLLASDPDQWDAAVEGEIAQIGSRLSQIEINLGSGKDEWSANFTREAKAKLGGAAKGSEEKPGVSSAASPDAKTNSGKSHAGGGFGTGPVPRCRRHAQSKPESASSKVPQRAWRPGREVVPPCLRRTCPGSRIGGQSWRRAMEDSKNSKVERVDGGEKKEEGGRGKEVRVKSRANPQSRHTRFVMQRRPAGVRNLAGKSSSAAALERRFARRGARRSDRARVSIDTRVKGSNTLTPPICVEQHRGSRKQPGRGAGASIEEKGISSSI